MVVCILLYGLQCYTTANPNFLEISIKYHVIYKKQYGTLTTHFKLLYKKIITVSSKIVFSYDSFLDESLKLCKSYVNGRFKSHIYINYTTIQYNEDQVALIVPSMIIIRFVIYNHTVLSLSENMLVYRELKCAADPPKRWNHCDAMRIKKHNITNKISQFPKGIKSFNYGLVNLFFKIKHNVVMYKGNLTQKLILNTGFFFFKKHVKVSFQFYRNGSKSNMTFMNTYKLQYYI